LGLTSQSQPVEGIKMCEDAKDPNIRGGEVDRKLWVNLKFFSNIYECKFLQCSLSKVRSELSANTAPKFIFALGSQIS
jgi:hypothetical protein